jgi:hypothetical protein
LPPQVAGCAMVSETKNEKETASESLMPKNMA